MSIKQPLKIVAVVGVFAAISVLMHLWSAPTDGSQTTIKHQPAVPYVVLQPTDYQVVLKSWGEVEPVEQTRLSSEVAGTVRWISQDFEQGGIVRKGSLLFALDSADFESRLIRAEAELAAKRVILVEQEAQAEVAKSQLRGITSSPSDLALHKPQVAAAEAALKAAEEEVRVAQRELERSRVYAPFNAVVVERQLGLGQVVNGGDVVAVLYNVDEAKVVAPVPHFDLPFLPPGEVPGVLVRNSQQVVNSLVGDGVQVTGRVVGQLGFVEAQTRMNQLLIKIDDPYQLLNSDDNVHFVANDRIPFGSHVEMAIPGVTLAGGFVIPQHLISHNQVWIIDAAERLQPVMVELLREDGTNAYVRGALQDGDRLVVQLPEFPHPGMAVRGIASE